MGTFLVNIIKTKRCSPNKFCLKSLQSWTYLSNFWLTTMRKFCRNLIQISCRMFIFLSRTMSLNPGQTKNTSNWIRPRKIRRWVKSGKYRRNNLEIRLRSNSLKMKCQMINMSKIASTKQWNYSKKNAVVKTSKERILAISKTRELECHWSFKNQFSLRLSKRMEKCLEVSKHLCHFWGRNWPGRRVIWAQIINVIDTSEEAKFCCAKKGYLGCSHVTRWGIFRIFLSTLPSRKMSFAKILICLKQWTQMNRMSK